MPAAVHVIDAGEGASALLACAVRGISAGEGARVVAVGTSAGRAMLARAGLLVDGWAGPPCGAMALASRPVARAVHAACGHAPDALTCWSADAPGASALEACVRRALPRCDVRAGSVASARGALAAAVEPGGPLSVAVEGSEDARRDARAAIGAGDASLVVVGAADAPHLANALRMLDVAGRAMLAGADVHLVLPACMPQRVRVQRYAQGLGLDGRLHIVEGAEWPTPWWRAADALIVADAAPLVDAAAGAIGVRVISAPGRMGDDASPELRAASASVRDRASTSIVAAARERAQSAMNASAASA